MSLERIRNSLSARIYPTLDAFAEDMQKLFDACLAFGEDHKYFKTFQAIQERFEKSVDRAKSKMLEGE